MIPLAEPALGSAELERVRAVLDSGHLARGPECEAFETAFADYCGVDHGVATANGTAALHAALRAVGVGEGDRVITTPLSFVATANAVRFCGATPVFADVDPETYTLDPDAAAAALREHDEVAAILVVHLYGLPAAMDRFTDLAAAHDVALVEDAAQAHGAAFDGRPVGSFGDAACFSFYPTKNMTTGEGGGVVTDRQAVAERVRRFVDHGRADGDPDTHVELGHNFRMPDLAAAIGRAQLEKLPGFTDDRRANAAVLTEGLADAPAVAVPTEPDRARHVYHQYTVRTPRREALAAHLEAAGVDTGVYYPRPIHRQPAYDRDVSLPTAEALTDEVLSLPVHPSLSPAALQTIVEAVHSFEP